MDTIKMINYILTVIFFICYAYQAVYVIIPFIVKEKPHKPAKRNRFAVLISARNEQMVIGNLIDSINRQTYPGELITTFVVADNCTDETARIAREHGAVVFERFNAELVGKGYALNWLLERIDAAYPDKPFDAYIVFRRGQRARAELRGGDEPHLLRRLRGHHQLQELQEFRRQLDQQRLRPLVHA